MLDNQVLQNLIQKIIESEQYTLEGISHHTRIPLDVVMDAAAGCSNQLSMTAWTSIASLYFEINPKMFEIFLKMLLQMKEKNKNGLFILDELKH